MRPPFLRPRKEEKTQRLKTQSSDRVPTPFPLREDKAVPRSLRERRRLPLPKQRQRGPTQAAGTRTRGAPRRRTEAGEGRGQLAGQAAGGEGRAGRAGRVCFRCLEWAESRCLEPVLLASLLCPVRRRPALRRSLGGSGHLGPSVTLG